jgi:hypothetical protein
MIEDMPRQSLTNDEGDRALLLGQLAAGIAPHDPAMAHGLIDRAFAIYLHPSDRTLGDEGGRAAQAALTAVHAQQIGYPDMESLVCQVLATRPTTADATFSPATVQESIAVMAMFLGLIDAPTAKQVLQGIEPNSDALGSGGTGVRRAHWLMAWALVDPPHAAELAAADLASAKDQPSRQRAQADIMELVTLWTIPPSQRLRYLSRDLLRNITL